MKPRLLLGWMIWFVGFNLSVALIAFYVSIGLAVAVLCLRHMVLYGIPPVYESWRRLVAEPGQPPLPAQPWPTRRWWGEAAVCSAISLAALIWLNMPLDKLWGR